MIRINLLPIKDQQRRTEGRTQLFMFLTILIIELGILGAIYFNAQNDLSELKTKVAQSTKNIAKMKEEVKDADDLKKQAERLEKQLDVLKQLESKRSGPVKVLDELQAIISPPRNDEDSHIQSQKDWNGEWDTRRLWLSAVTEKGNVFEMKGGALSPDDVAEFLQRLTTAKHFQNIQLDYVQAETLQSKKRNSKGREFKYVSYRLTGNLSYSGEKLKAADLNKGKKSRRRRR